MNELIESQREVIAILKSIGNRHPNDAATQRDVARASLEVAEQMSKLSELLGYRDPSPEGAQTQENGTERT